MDTLLEYISFCLFFTILVSFRFTSPKQFGEMNPLKKKVLDNKFVINVMFYLTKQKQ